PVNRPGRSVVFSNDTGSCLGDACIRCASPRAERTTAMAVQYPDARAPGDIATPTVRDADRGDWADIREIVQAAYRTFAAHLPPLVFARYIDDLLALDEHARRGQL